MHVEKLWAIKVIQQLKSLKFEKKIIILKHMQLVLFVHFI